MLAYKKLVKNIFVSEAFDEEKIILLNKKRKMVYTDYNDDWVYLAFLKFFQFIETKLGIQIELSFKFFDTLHFGIVFYTQFHQILNQCKSGLIEKEIDAIFCYIDASNKRFYIFESDYSIILKKVLYNPGINRKAYVKLLQEKTKFVSTGNTELIQGASHKNKINEKSELLLENIDQLVIKNKISFQPSYMDYSNIIYNIFKNLSSKKKTDLTLKTFLFDTLPYLPVGKLIHKLEALNHQISNFEIKVLVDYYLDIDKLEVLYEEEYKDRIENT
jgi:hypothetical protein